MSNPSAGRDVDVLRSGTSTLKRSGSWTVASRLEVMSLTGAVKLDFRQAALPKGPVTISLKTGTGAVELVLPEGATADVSAVVSATGRVRSAVRSTPTATATHFIIEGVTGTGEIWINYRRKVLGLF